MGLSRINTTLRYLILLSLRRGRPAPASRTRHLAVSSLILGQTPDSCRSTPSSVLGLASSPARYSVHSKRHLFSRDCPRVHAACAAGLPIVLPITGGNSSFYVSFSRPHLPVVLHLVRISSSRDLSRCRRLPYRLLQEAPHPPCLMLPRRPLVRLPASQDSSPVHEIDSVPSTPFRRPTSRRSHLLSFRDPFPACFRCDNGKTFRRAPNLCRLAAEASIPIASSPPVSLCAQPAHCDKVRDSVERPPLPRVLRRLRFLSPRRRFRLFSLRPSSSSRQVIWLSVKSLSFSTHGCESFDGCSLRHRPSFRSSLNPSLSSLRQGSTFRRAPTLPAFAGKASMLIASSPQFSSLRFVSAHLKARSCRRLLAFTAPTSTALLSNPASPLPA